MDKANLTGLEKASILILSLDREQSSAVLDQLTDEERVVIGAQIMRLRKIDHATRGQVLAETGRAIGSMTAVVRQPSARARSGMLQNLVGSLAGLLPSASAPSPSESTRISSPEELLKISPENLYKALSGSDPLDLALVVSVASGSLQDHILNALSAPLRGEVLERFSSLSNTKIAEVEAAQQRVVAAATAPSSDLRAQTSPKGGRR